MKRSQLVILVLLVVVLGAAAWLLAKRSTTSWQSSAGHLTDKVVSLPINDVAQVTIKQPEAEVNLVKKTDTWVVAERADYPADFEMISTLIRKVWELKPVQELKVGPSQLGRLSLVEPGKDVNSGTLVDFKAADGKRLAALLLGKKHLRESDAGVAPRRSFPAGRYVMPQDGSNRVALVAESFEQIDNKPERWLDREFIKIEKPNSIVCAGTSPAMNWKLERAKESAEWKLADAKADEQTDASKAKQTTNSIDSVTSFVDVLAPDARPETTGLDKPVTFTITTEDNFVYVLRIGKKIGENYVAAFAVSATIPKERTAGTDEKPEEKKKLDEEFQTKRDGLEKKLAKEQKFEARPYLLAKFVVEQLEKNRADLLAAKPTPTATQSPTVKPRK
jgi:Domain of unknown function (DUF4340)